MGQAVVTAKPSGDTDLEAVPGPVGLDPTFKARAHPLGKAVDEGPGQPGDRRGSLDLHDPAGLGLGLALGTANQPLGQGAVAWRATGRERLTERSR